MMKDTMKSMYIATASTLGLGDFTKINKSATNKELTKKRHDLITICVEGYIKATKDEDETKRSAYIAALMLMFWHEIGKMADKCKAVREYEYDDFASKLYECISEAINYYEADKAAGKKVSAEAYINSLISSRGAPAILYESNLEKNKANVNTYSLNTTVSDDEGSERTRLDLVEDKTEDVAGHAENPAEAFVQYFLDVNKPIEAIIFDIVATTDCVQHTAENCVGVNQETEETYKYKKYFCNISPFKVVKNLRDLPANFIEYFTDKYDTRDEIVEVAVNAIKQISDGQTNTKFYKFLDKTFAGAESAAKKILAGYWARFN